MEGQKKRPLLPYSYEYFSGEGQEKRGRTSNNYVFCVLQETGWMLLVRMMRRQKFFSFDHESREMRFTFFYNTRIHGSCVCGFINMASRLLPCPSSPWTSSPPAASPGETRNPSWNGRSKTALKRYLKRLFSARKEWPIKVQLLWPF